MGGGSAELVADFTALTFRFCTKAVVHGRDFMLTMVIQDGVVTAAEVGLDQPSAGSRSAWFPAQRYSIATFWPST